MDAMQVAKDLVKVLVKELAIAHVLMDVVRLAKTLVKHLATKMVVAIHALHRVFSHAEALLDN